MDPQQRLLLEVAHEALEHAGHSAVIRCGVRRRAFSWGHARAEYGYLATADLSQVNAWSGTGGALEHYRQSVLVFLRSAGSVGDRGHGVFVVAGGGAFGVSEPARREIESGVGRRGEFDADTGGHSQLRSAEAMSPTGVVKPSMPPRTVMCAARVAGWWCSSGSVMRCVTGIGCWRWCGVRRSIRTAGPTG